jgi:hypothetical protein
MSHAVGNVLDSKINAALKNAMLLNEGVNDRVHQYEEWQLNVFSMKMRSALSEHGAAASAAMTAEYAQLLKLNTFHPVWYHELSKFQKTHILRSFPLFKEKRLPDGTFDKFKLRHVVNGAMQDKALLGNIASCTVRTESVLLELVRAVQQHRTVRTVDITGAFLKAHLPLDSQDQVVVLDADASSVIVKLEPSWIPYLRKDNTLLVVLDKAMYGLCEAPKAWYDEISTFLESMGCIQNPYDPCVYNLMMNGVQLTICFHVDDLLITCTDTHAIDWIINQLTVKYESITVHDELILHYLGLTIDLTKHDQAIVSQVGLIESVLSWYEVDRQHPAITPALPTIMEDTSESPALIPLGAKTFHTIIATLLFIAKRTRPDILFAVNILCGRVLRPTEADRLSLCRLLSYLSGTIDMPLILRVSTKEGLGMSIDAAFGTHSDMHSHTGARIMFHGGTIFAKSSKQDQVAKSSTEGEIYGVSSTLSEGLWCKLYLEQQGEDIGMLTVEQDNKSAMALFDRGYSNSDKTRHLHIRHFWIKDMVKGGLVQIVYTPTAEISADILTKALQGSAFRSLRAKLLGHISA